MIVTVDGPSGTGKSTVAKLLAQKLGFTFFDTGAMYRAIAWHLIELGVSLDDLSGIEHALKDFSYTIKQVGSEKHYFANQTDVTNSIRSPEITAAASKVSAYSQVREKAWKWQRQFGTKGKAVFEGRDMGTVVFPNADLKIFLTATSDIRAKRRLLELQQKYPGQQFSYEEIFEKINERDHQDSTRSLAPLKKAEDAYEIDTSHLSVNDVVDKIILIANQKQLIHDTFKK